MAVSEQRDWVVTEVTAAGRYRFGIACGTDATVDTDPVAYSYRHGSLEHLNTLIDLFLSVHRPGQRALDLGAHLGGFSLMASAAGCQTLAVEASPRNVDLLAKSKAYGRFQNLEIVHAAVSDRPGALEFASDGAWGRVLAAGETRASVRVPAVTVDDLLAERKWDGVGFVKLDVEGSEVRAVNGMRKLLARRDAPVVFFESNLHTLEFYDESHDHLKGLFRELGYQVYAVKAGRLDPVKPGEDQPETVMDFLAVRKLPAALRGWLPPKRPSLLARVRRKLLSVGGRLLR